MTRKLSLSVLVLLSLVFVASAAVTLADAASMTATPTATPQLTPQTTTLAASDSLCPATPFPVSQLPAFLTEAPVAASATRAPSCDSFCRSEGYDFGVCVWTTCVCRYYL